MELISPQEAHRRKREEGWKHLDVRTTAEFVEGHPPDAVCLPVMIKSKGKMVPNEEFLDRCREQFSAGDRVVVSCGTGKRSAIACNLFKSSGVSVTVADVEGGFQEWVKDKDLPISKG